ncbi:MAG: ABC transporter substrate-binding protein [Fibrobacterota bacterium]
MAKLLVALLLLSAVALHPAHRFLRPKEKELPPPDRTVSEATLKGAEKAFRSAVQLFKERKYDKALPGFLKILKKCDACPFAEASAVLAAECELKLNDLEEARWLLRLFPKRFPGSQYQSRCDYLSAYLQAVSGDAYGAAQHYLAVYQSTLHPELARLSAQSLMLLFDARLSPDQIDALAGRIDSVDPLHGAALYYAGKRYLELRENVKAGKDLAAFTGRFSGHPLFNDGVELLKRVRRSGDRTVKIGVLVPRTAENSLFNDIGSSILRGIEIAVEYYNASHSDSVRLVVRDTRASAARVFQLTRELMEKEGVAAIIGPLSSDELCVTGALTLGKGIPVVSPKASGMGIDSLGGHVFLFTPTKARILRVLADYAFDSLKIREYAMVFPNDEYGSVMAAAFRDAVEERGGEVFGYEMYQRGEKNFKEVLSRLHVKKVESIFEQQALDRGEMMSLFENRVIVVDSLFMADSAVQLGAVFMPGYPEEITILGPQLPFYQIHTQMLGASGWIDADVLKHAGRYIENAVVAEDFLFDKSATRTRDFQERYARRYRDKAGTDAALGYDCLNFILSGLAEGPDLLLRRLQKTAEFEGALGRFVFDPVTHSNQNAVLLKVTDEEFRPLPLSRTAPSK